MQIIYLDLADRRAMEVIEAKQGDVGRKFQIVLTDRGEDYEIPTDALLSVWYTGSSGCGNYSAIGEKSAFTVEGNTVTVELITQMLNVRGGGILCLRMNSADGSQIGIWNIQYLAEAVPGLESEEAEQYYTAFSEAAAQLAGDVDLMRSSLARLDTDFAPSGLGLGMQLAQTSVLTDLNNPHCLTGYYSYTTNTANLPSDIFGGGFVLVENHIADSVVYQTVVNNSPYVVCKRRYYNGTWTEWEWVNPPMTTGIEYRTTERWNGKPVYTALINCGKFPSVGTNTVSHGLSASQIVRCVGTADYFGIVLPYTDSTNNTFIADVWAHKRSIFVRCNTTIWTDYDCFVQLWYTKD